MTIRLRVFRVPTRRRVVVLLMLLGAATLRWPTSRVIVDAKAPDLSFDGTVLVAAVKPRRLPGNSPSYSLYELVPAADAKPRYAALLRVQGARGLRSEPGIGDPMITVVARRVSAGRLENGQVRFELPPSGNYATACYVMSDPGSYVTPRPSGGNTDRKFAFSLRAAEQALALSRQLTMASTAAAEAESARSTLAQRLSRATFDLPRHEAFQGGRCSMPPQEPLPPQPPGSLPFLEAQSLAQAVVLDVMSKRLGCELMAEFANRTGFASDWQRFLDRFRCGRTNLPRLYTYTEITPFMDYLESRLLSCAVRDVDCLLPAAALLFARYTVNVEEITRTLYEPFQRWQAQVAALAAAPQRLFAECRTLETLLESADALTAAASTAVARTGAELAAARARLDDFARKGVSRDDWFCATPFKAFNAYGQTGLSFVN